MRLQRFFVGCPFFLIHDSSTMTPLPPARPASAVPVSPAAPRRIGGRGARGEGRSSSAFIASGVGSDPAPHIRHGKHLLFPTPPAAAMHRGAGAIPGRDPGRVPHYPQLPTYMPQSDLIHTPGIDYQPMPHAVPSSTITSVLECTHSLNSNLRSAHKKVCALQIAGSRIGALHKVYTFELQGHLKCIHL